MELMVLGCDGSYPSANGACSGYLVKHENEAVLFDCGSGVLGKLMALMDPAKLTAVMITHWHNDHASDLLVLQYYLLINKQKLTVYAPMDLHPLRELCLSKEFIFKDIKDADCFGAMQANVFPVHHSVPAYAIKLTCEGRSIVYTGDTDRWEDLVSFCYGVDLLLCDATFSKEQCHENLPHLTAQQAAHLSREAKVRQLMLTHFQPCSDAGTLTAQASEIDPLSLAAKAGNWYSV